MSPTKISGYSKHRNGRSKEFGRKLRHENSSLSEEHLLLFLFRQF
jgi:hypothetical protein